MKYDEQAFRIISLTSEYQVAEKRLLLDLERKLNKNCYVSFSAGKDSSVVAHACQRVMPGIPILMVDPGCPIHWTEEEREEWVSYSTANAWNLRLFPWDKFGANADAVNMAKYRRQIHQTMFADLIQYAHENDLTMRVDGIRASESSGRGMAVAYPGKNIIHPIGKWPTKFVWAYIAKHSLPTLSIYRLVGPDARNGLVGRNGEAQGRMAYLRRYYPEAWQIAKAQYGIT